MENKIATPPIQTRTYNINAISEATLADVPQLAALINSGYRGDESLKGWTSEAHLLDGQRVDEDELIRQMNDASTTILKYSDDAGNIKGCVSLQKQRDKLYLGMLTVQPLAQTGGIGKQLLAAAEDFARSVGLYTITMTVITSRHELIAYYERRGYSKTGELVDLHIPERFGIPRQPLQFLKMNKGL